MRLFIAINLNDKTKSALLALRDELRINAESGSFTRPENLHLTLAFLGECNVKQLSAAEAAMKPVSFEQFDLMIDRVGWFGGKQSAATTWWAGARESKELLDLQRDLTDRLTETGFALERRRYSPHITIGRRVVTDYAPWRFEPFYETVSKIDLMDSQRIDGRLIYTKVFERAAGS